MALVRWEPFRDLLAMQQQMNRLFEGYSGRFHGTEEEESLAAWAPPVDIYETKDQIVVKAEIPGVDKDKISVEVREGNLILKGEKKEEKEVKEEDYYRMERSWGAFSRTFSLPVEVDATKIKAKYHDGILEVTVPKTEKAKPKQIPVEAMH